MYKVDPESERGRAWLSQFKELDRPDALDLLSAIDVVPAGEFERWLRHVHSSLPLDNPVAVYAVRGLEDVEEVFEGKALSIRRTRGSIGSEGRIAHAIKRWNSRARGPRVLDTPSLVEMAAEQVRTIVLLDDLIGSGDRMLDYLESILLSKTVRSWISGGQIRRIRLMSYASLPDGVISIERYIAARAPSQRKALGLEVELERASLAGTPAKGERRRRLLRAYRHKLPSGLRELTFGHGRSMGDLVFEHGCPDNVPALLWAPGGRDWEGVFESRYVEMDAVTPPRPGPRGRLSGGPKHLGEVLGQIAMGARTDRRIALFLGIPFSLVPKARAYLVKLGAVTGDGRMTPLGRALLKEVPEPVQFAPTIPLDEVYIPRR